MEIVELYLFDSRELDLESLLDMLNLSNEDLKALEQYKNDIVKKEKAISQYFKNKYIGPYFLNEYGKPLSKDKYFNISHSKGIVGLAISNNRDIGLDIELIRDNKEELVRYISNDEEYKYIQNKENFFEIWTSKEALVKCLGTGIKSRLEEIPSLPINGNKKYKNKDYYSKTIKKDDLIISICLSGNKEFDIKITKNNT